MASRAHNPQHLTLSALPERHRTTEYIEKALGRIEARTQLDSNGCLVCSLALDPKGYSTVGIGRTAWRTHRFVWEARCGPIPPGMTLDHKCRNKCCVNVEHLEPVSYSENTIRQREYERQLTGLKRGRNPYTDVCARGHDITVPGSRRSDGACRPCIRLLKSARRRRIRELNLPLSR